MGSSQTVTPEVALDRLQKRLNHLDRMYAGAVKRGDSKKVTLRRLVRMGIILAVLSVMLLLNSLHNVPIYVGVLVLIGGIGAVAVSGTLLSPPGGPAGSRNLPEYYLRREELEEKIRSYRKMVEEGRHTR